MALIKCSNCGEEISDKVNKCIHCGSKIISIENQEKNKIKKAKKHKRRKKIKIFIVIILVIAIVLGLYLGIARLFPKKNINYIEKYQAYLNYALGTNWEVINSYSYYVYNDLWFEEITNWTIGYRDKNNEVQQIYINNYELTEYKQDDIASDYLFAIYIMESYMDKLQEQLRKGNVTPLDNYITLYNLGIKYIFNSGAYTERLFVDNITDYIKAETGLNFQELSINSLDPDIYLFSLEVYYKSGNNIHEYTINHAKTFIEQNGINNAIVGSGMSDIDSNGYQQGVLSHGYCLKNNQQISCPIQTDIEEYREVFGEKKNYIKLK